MAAPHVSVRRAQPAEAERFLQLPKDEQAKFHTDTDGVPLVYENGGKR